MLAERAAAAVLALCSCWPQVLVLWQPQRRVASAVAAAGGRSAQWRAAVSLPAAAIRVGKGEKVVIFSEVQCRVSAFQVH